MINYVREDIFNLNIDAIVIPINCVGVMGKGLALQAKTKYFDMYTNYRARCLAHEINPGTVYYYNIFYNDIQSQEVKPKMLILFPTKDNWRNPSKFEYITSGLNNFAESYQSFNIKSVAFPKLGCGCGGLDWEKEVKPYMEKFLNNLPIDIYICN